MEQEVHPDPRIAVAAMGPKDGRPRAVLQIAQEDFVIVPVEWGLVVRCT